MEKFRKYKTRYLSSEPLYIRNISWDNERIKVTLESESSLEKIYLLFDETVYL